MKPERDADLGVRHLPLEDGALLTVMQSPVVVAVVASLKTASPSAAGELLSLVDLDELLVPVMITSL